MAETARASVRLRSVARSTAGPGSSALPFTVKRGPINARRTEQPVARRQGPFLSCFSSGEKREKKIDVTVAIAHRGSGPTPVVDSKERNARWRVREGEKKKKKSECQEEAHVPNQVPWFLSHFFCLSLTAT